MKKILSVIALFALLLSAAPASAAHRWRLVSNGMPGNMLYEAAEEFAETVRVLSNGALTIEVFAPCVLFPAFETFDNTANGVVQANLLFGLYWPGKNPHFNLLSRPGCPVNIFMEAAYLEEKLAEWQNKLYNPFGMTYLGSLQVSTVNENLMSVVPIRTVADFQGVRIRSSGFGARFYTELGATAVSLSAPEIYPALQTRNIEGAEWTAWEDNMRMGFHEVVNYVIEGALHCGVYENMPLVVNTAAWNALPQNLKDIVDVARQKMMYRSSLFYIEEMKAKQIWQAMPNMEIVHFSDEDNAMLRATGLRLLREEAEKTELGMEYLTIYRNTLWELGHHEEAKTLGYEPN